MEYLIRVTRTTEFETTVEADDPLAAADMAKMEATGNSVITNEMVDIRAAPPQVIEDVVPACYPGGFYEDA